MRTSETFIAYSRSSLPEIDIGDTYVGVLERWFPMVLHRLRVETRREKNGRKFVRTDTRIAFVLGSCRVGVATLPI